MLTYTITTYQMGQYRQIEIWLANFIVTDRRGTYTLKDQVAKKLPSELLLKDSSFISRIKNKIPAERMSDKKKKGLFLIEFEYIRQIGIVNQKIEEEL